MNKYLLKTIALLLFLLVFSTTTGWSQSLEEKLAKIEDFKDAKAFYQMNNADYHIYKSVYKTGNKINEVTRLILEDEEKDLFQKDEIWYKVIKKNTYQGSNVRYIFFDEKKLGLADVNYMRDSVLLLFQKNPTEDNFIELANKYTMDGNDKGGQLEWYDPEHMVETFSAAVIDHQKDDVFKIDIPDRQWYYIVLKLDQEKTITTLSYLEVSKKEE